MRYVGREAKQNVKVWCVPAGDCVSPLQVAVDLESPYSGAKYVHVPYLSQRDAMAKVDEAARVQKEWAKVPLAERIAIVRRFMTEFQKMEERVAKDITNQMGAEKGLRCVRWFSCACASLSDADADAICQFCLRLGKPLNQSKNEIKGLFGRINALIDQAPEALRPDVRP